VKTKDSVIVRSGEEAQLPEWPNDLRRATVRGPKRRQSLFVHISVVHRVARVRLSCDVGRSNP